ncbi:MAG: hypothetical protein DLM58_12680 [Pseudonocardiales bacterium]|nr:MAG: hypothetical protein DLM58_12680 [Pseudonocardiales bacterium]
MVQTIPVPANVAEFAALDRFDYDEAFAVDIATDLSAEEWARLSIEGAPPPMRAAMLNGWKSLLIRLAPLDSEGQVLGWRIHHSEPQAIVLGIESRIGMTVRIVIQVQPTQVVHAMVVRYDRIIARPVWAVVSSPHRRFVRTLLADAQRRAVETATAVLRE